MATWLPLSPLYHYQSCHEQSICRICFLNLLGTCLGSAMGLLGIWSGVSLLSCNCLESSTDHCEKVQARLHTTPAGSRDPYSSSHSVVCAIWLFFNIYLANAVRARYFALQVPVIIYSIFMNVSFIFGTRQPTTQAAKSFIKTLLECFLTAQGLGLAVNWLIFPVTCRKVIFKETGCFHSGC